ncbi:hypothetical protein AAC387_Pa08g1679 [Persea americana]
MVSLRKNTTVWPIFSFSLLFLHFNCQFPVTFVQAASSVHIVYLGEKQHDNPAEVVSSHHDMLATLLGSKEAAKSSILYSYKHGFSGFAATLTESQAESIGDYPGVIRVIPNRIHKLHTTRSWDFLGLRSHDGKNFLSESKMGEDIIVGVIDTGIWPESKSFTDKGMSAIPSRWKGHCQHGESFNSTNCNRKLIGARWFIKGLAAEMKKPINTTESGEFLSPRDRLGHGTHTASTAVGRLVENVSYRGLAAGVARGGAPLSRLAIYKVCWEIGGGGCTDADLLKAFDQAIHDGVDILSVSIGLQVPLLPYVMHDGIAIGTFHSVAKGIAVVCSAGNEGPFSQTVENTAPWIINVAATTIDRAFPTAITLGNNHTLLGQSLATKTHDDEFHGIAYSDHIADKESIDSKDCQYGSLNSTLAAGKVILCFSIESSQTIADAAFAIHAAGGVGVIFAQSTDNLPVSCDLIPCIEVNYEVGTEILSYIRSTRSPVVKLGSTKSVIGKWKSPRVAYFSSRGPGSLAPTVLKPDIAAPGVNILAAYPPLENSDKFVIESGTSMACPHVAGIVALIKFLHPDWSPAAIKSALVTTASQTGTDGEAIIAEGGNRKPADAFDMGGGLVNPNKAANPGLIYDMNMGDYIQFLCSMGYSNSLISSAAKKNISCLINSRAVIDMNLPSICIPNLKRTVTISRTVTNVGPFNSSYTALVQSPHGFKVAIKPQILSFNSSTTTLSFKMTFSSTQKVHGDYSFGSLTWTDGSHYVRSPIVVRAIKFESYADM